MHHIQNVATTWRWAFKHSYIHTYVHMHCSKIQLNFCFTYVCFKIIFAENFCAPKCLVCAYANKLEIHFHLNINAKYSELNTLRFFGFIEENDTEREMVIETFIYYRKTIWRITPSNNYCAVLPHVS